MTAPLAGSRTVDWYAVHLLVAPVLDMVGSWPMAGSLPWQHLPDHDPAKWAAVLDAAQHWALHIELRQEALADASKAVAASTDWPKAARELQQLHRARQAGSRIERTKTVA